MSRKPQAMRTKLQNKGKTVDTPTTLVAAICAVAILPYADLVIKSAGDETSQAAVMPSWRVHMLSAWLGTVCFVITLFCLESLVQKSKAVAFRSTIPWSPLVVLTGVATIFRIHILIVMVAAASYGAWMFWRQKRVLPVIN
jgi:hypothetical protein